MIRKFFLAMAVVASNSALVAEAAWPPRLRTDQSDGTLRTVSDNKRVVLRGTATKIAGRRAGLPPAIVNRVNLRYVDWATNPRLNVGQGLNGHHAKVIRLVLTTEAFDNGDSQKFGTRDFRDKGPMDDFRNYFRDFVVPAIDLCERQGVYCALDLQIVDKYSLKIRREYLEPLWVEIARHPKVKNQRGVFLELFNEPTMDEDAPIKDENKDGDIDYLDYNLTFPPSERWRKYKNFIQVVVDKIRLDAGARNMIIIGSTNFDTDFKGISVSNSIIGNKDDRTAPHNILYNYHLYPKVSNRFTGDKIFDRPDNAGNNRGGTDLLKSTLPIFMTEFAWTGDTGPQPQQATTAEWGRPLRAYLDGATGTALPPQVETSISSRRRSSISWTPWIVEPDRNPGGIASYDVVDKNGDPPDYLNTPLSLNGHPKAREIKSYDHFGWFVYKWLQDKRFDDQP